MIFTPSLTQNKGKHSTVRKRCFFLIAFTTRAIEKLKYNQTTAYDSSFHVKSINKQSYAEHCTLKESTARTTMWRA
jgi:hypothetical protein